MLKMHENTVRDLIRTGKKTKHGVYLKKEWHFFQKRACHNLRFGL
jgi:hypothetical protein